MNAFDTKAGPALVWCVDGFNGVHALRRMDFYDGFYGPVCAEAGCGQHMGDRERFSVYFAPREEITCPKCKGDLAPVVPS